MKTSCPYPPYERQPRIELIQELIEAYPLGLAQPNKQGLLPLHLACDTSMPNRAVINLLVEEFKAALRVADKKKRLPLHIAIVENGETESETVFFLLSKFQGALRIPGPDGKLALHLVVEGGDKYRRGLGHDDYISAVENGEYIPVAQKLVHSYPGAMMVADSRGYLPLHYAITITKPHDWVADFAEYEKDDDIDGFYDPEFDSDMDPYILQYLLSLGTGALNYCMQESGQTPLHMAAMNLFWHSDILESACFYRRSDVSDVLQVRDNDGMTPLHVLVESGTTFDWGTVVSEERQKYMDRWEKSVRIFVDQFSAALEWVDNKGRLPLHIAAAGKWTPLGIIDLLIEKYPEGLQVVDRSGRSPYFVAATSDAPLDFLYSMVRCNPSKLLGFDPFGVAKFMIANRDLDASRKRKRKRKRKC